MDETEIQSFESGEQKYSTDISGRSADDLLEIGNKNLKSGKFNEALKYYENALKLYRIDKDRLGESHAIAGLGVIYEKCEDFENAVKYYKLSLKKSKKSKDKKRAKEISKLLADLLLVGGDKKADIEEYEEAGKKYKESYNYYRSSGDYIGKGYALTGLGILHERNEEYDESRSYYERALKNFQKSKDYERAGIISNLIANTYEAHEALEDALIDYNRSLELFKKSRDTEREKEIKESINSIKEKRSAVKINKKQVVYLSFYLIILVVAELLTTYFNIELGLILHLFLLLILLIHASLEKSRNFSFLLLSMMAVPMIRIIGLTIPIMQTPTLYWFPIIAVPLFASTLTIAMIQKISRKNLGLTIGNIPVQLVIASTGIFLGFIEYQILHPKPLIPSFNIESIIIAGFILIISTGLAEELLFRGIIQKNAENVLGSIFGLLYSALLFTSMHIGWNNVYDWIFVFCVAIFYGYAFQKTRSLFGVTLSHGISNSVLFLIMPFWVF